MGYLRKVLTISISFILIISMSPQVEANKSEIQVEHIRISDVKKFEIIEFITISNDQNFTDYGFSGSGTAENPYIIENYTIDEYDYHYGIIVRDTTKHFVIRNCTVRAVWSGILVVNVSKDTATIINNTILISPGSDVAVGIEIIDTTGTTIANNHCIQTHPGFFEQTAFGIYILNSNCELIQNNICEKYESTGIFSVSNDNGIIEGNNCSFNGVGISLWDTINNTIVNNSCEWNVVGVTFAESKILVVNNTISFNERGGIGTDDIKDSVFTNNTIEFNGSDGINAQNFDRCYITYNIIRNNTKYCVSLDKESWHNSVHHNIFEHNNIGGRSQAYDSGYNNTWYEKGTNEGNFWGSDWDQENPYSIIGIVNNTDPYPLDENLERHSATSFFFPTIILFLALLSINRTKRKLRECKIINN